MVEIATYAEGTLGLIEVVAGLLWLYYLSGLSGTKKWRQNTQKVLEIRRQRGALLRSPSCAFCVCLSMAVNIEGGSSSREHKN